MELEEIKINKCYELYIGTSKYIVQVIKISEKYKTVEVRILNKDFWGLKIGIFYPKRFKKELSKEEVLLEML